MKQIPTTEQLAATVPGCSQGDAAPKGLGSDGNKPLMQNREAHDDEALRDRDTAGDNFPICPGCKNEIDPEVCWCGDTIKSHNSGSGHSPVPMGCDCARDKSDSPLVGLDRPAVSTDPHTETPRADSRKEIKPAIANHQEALCEPVRVKPGETVRRVPSSRTAPADRIELICDLARLASRLTVDLPLPQTELRCLSVVVKKLLTE